MYVSPLKALNFSQVSLSVKTKDGMPLNNLAENLKKGWVGKGIDCAFINGKLVTYDHRRPVAAIAADVRVKVNISDINKEKILERMKRNGINSPLKKVPYFNDQNPFIGEKLENYNSAIKIRGVYGAKNFISFWDAAKIVTNKGKKDKKGKHSPKCKLSF